MLRSVERIQITEPDDVLLGVSMPDVLRVASELYAQDRAQVERAAQRQGLKQAAAEAGLPPEYLERAAVTLHARLKKQRRRWRGVLAAAALTLTAGIGWSLAGHHARPAAASPRPSLAECDLRGADLRHQNLAGENLSGSNLRGAMLTGANLRGANLHTADLVGADLTGADLSGADVNYATFSQSTRWPAGYVAMQHNARFVGDSYPPRPPARGWRR